MKEHHIANAVSIFGISMSIADINALLTMASLMIAIGLNIFLLVKAIKKK